MKDYTLFVWKLKQAPKYQNAKMLERTTRLVGKPS